MGTRIYLKSKKAPVVVAESPEDVQVALVRATPAHGNPYAQFSAPGEKPGDFVGPVYVLGAEVVGFRANDRVATPEYAPDALPDEEPADGDEYPEAGGMSLGDGLGG